MRYVFNPFTGNFDLAGTTSRDQASVITASVNNGETTTATITLPKSAIVIAVASNKAGWLRLYNSSAAATSDAARVRTTDPTAGSGVLLETIFSASSTITLSPPASVINVEATPSTSYSVAFTNDGTTGAATLTVSYLSLES